MIIEINETNRMNSKEEHSLPNINEFYKRIQHLPNVLSFIELLSKFDDLKIFHNQSYLKLINKWDSGKLPHPPILFGLEGGVFFSATSIYFLYKTNDEQRIKRLPYNYMNMYLGNKDSKFTQYLAELYSEADWSMINDFRDYYTDNYKIWKANENERKIRLLETLQELKVKLADRMPVLEYEQLLDKYNNFRLFEADKNWESLHWYRKGLESWKNGKASYPPILFGLESGLMFGKTAFICNYRVDQGESKSKRYYLRIDYRNINHPDFEKRLSKFLTTNDMDVLKELGKMLME